MNSFVAYCEKCKVFYYGWGRNICPVCGLPLVEKEKKEVSKPDLKF